MNIYLLILNKCKIAKEFIQKTKYYIEVLNNDMSSYRDKVLHMKVYVNQICQNFCQRSATTYDFTFDDVCLTTTDATTGMIRTRALVDREARERYTVVVVAQDLGRPPQLSSRLLTINITDMDDNPPVFVRLPVCPGGN